MDMKSLRYIVLVLLVLPLGLLFQGSSAGEALDSQKAERFKRYQTLMQNMDQRRHYHKEFKDLYIYFNYGMGRGFLRANPILIANEPVIKGETVEDPYREEGLINPIGSSLEKSSLDLSSLRGSGIYSVIENKLNEIGVPELYQKYLSVEKWSINLDQDPYRESIISIRLYLASVVKGSPSYQKSCPRLSRGHIIFLIDPSNSQEDYSQVYTLSQQNHVIDICECVGCLTARLVDVYDFEADGMAEIITYEKVYGTVHFKTYGYQEGKGYRVMSYHPRWDS